ncbi:MAG TPA: glycine rich domain-containing protein [bacterium]|nr:glycine rich domain-containing protein [bacterium]
MDDDPPPCVPGTFTFEYTGAEQTWTVPSGTGTYTAEVWGAQGGQGSADGIAQGALGGYAKGTLSVTSGQILYVYVGQGNVYSTTTLVSAFNGGGAGRGNSDTNTRGAGGGASDIRIDGNAFANRVIVAGGGGGSSGTSYIGGAGGGVSGSDGTGGLPGTGGTQTAGGISAFEAEMTHGSLGQGGGLTEGSTFTLAGGGGGYYGGGGGLGAGGGSGYIGGVTEGTMQNGVNSGNGKVVITRTCP